MSSKRVNVTVEEELYKDLEEWADQQKRPIASLAAYLLHQAVKDAKESGEFKPKTLTIEEASTIYARASILKTEVSDEVIEVLSESMGIETDKLREGLKVDLSTIIKD